MNNDIKSFTHTLAIRYNGKFVGNNTYELPDEPSVYYAFKLAETVFPDNDLKGFKLSDGESTKYFLEIE